MTDPFNTMVDSTRGCSLASRIKSAPTNPYRPCPVPVLLPVALLRTDDESNSSC